MGVVNVTPDSFSDGGCYLDTTAAIAHALELEREGADLLDIGGESTRPGAAPVPVEEELARVMPVLRGLAGRVRVPLSIDTRKPEVARAALEAGACIVNDVGAGAALPEMAALVAARGAGYVCMHMQGTPETMQARPHYEDLGEEVADFFAAHLERLRLAGVAAEQVVLDVGIGFGKTLEHNLLLLATLESFRRFNRPLVLGVSRKSFLGELLGVDVTRRVPGSLACAAWAVTRGVEVIRAHDVAATRDVVRTIEALMIRRRC